MPDPAVIDDNDNGIETYANLDLSNNLAVFLTNRKVGTGTTMGSGTKDLFTQDLGSTPGNYNFQCYVTGFNSSTPAGCSFTIFGSIRTDGNASAIVGIQDKIQDKEIALNNVDVDILASVNNVILRVTNNTVLNINWKVLANYIFIG